MPSGVPQGCMLPSRSRRAARWCALFLGLLLGEACASAPPKAPVSEPVAPAKAASALTQAPIPPILLRDVGFAGPRAAIHDEQADVYLVSNVNGQPTDADGNGFISRVAPDGTLLELRWIDGASGGMLDAPKGMALRGDKLYVADLNVLRSFDRKSGAPIGKIAIAAASYLDALAFAPDGTLYVSDSGLGKSHGPADLESTGSDAIYAINSRGEVGVFAKGRELGAPSGLLSSGSGLWVVNSKGELALINNAGERHQLAQLPGGGLEGLIQTDSGRLVLSCASTASVYMSGAPPAPGVAFEPLISDLASPAQLGYDRHRRQLLVPLVRENALYIQQIPGG
jgi:hypothetical protein